MNEVPELVRLPGGRRLAIARYGADDGLPMLYCHGFPGSRLEACLAAPAARELGVTLIAADRPGFGRSDPAPERILTDWPRDLLGLADRLGLGRFHLVGVSGGGPYALAAAAAIPERLAGVGVVCGLGELGGPEDTGGMAPMAARAIRLYQRMPGFADWLYSHLAAPLFSAHPDWIFRLIAGSAPPSDQAVLADTDVRECLLGSFREAFAQGGEGPARELAIYTSPWGIDLGAIRAPVDLWHGEQDTTVPVGMGRRHADRIPGVRAHFLSDEGHFSLVVNHMTTILSQLAAR